MSSPPKKKEALDSTAILNNRSLITCNSPVHTFHAADWIGYTPSLCEIDRSINQPINPCALCNCQLARVKKNAGVNVQLD